MMDVAPRDRSLCTRITVPDTERCNHMLVCRQIVSSASMKFDWPKSTTASGGWSSLIPVTRTAAIRHRAATSADSSPRLVNEEIPFLALLPSRRHRSWVVSPIRTIRKFFTWTIGRALPDFARAGRLASVTTSRAWPLVLAPTRPAIRRVNRADAMKS